MVFVAPMYEDEWEQYRKLRKEFLVAFLGFIPAVGSAAIIGFGFLASFIPGLAVLICYGALLFVVTYRLALWRCPRCNDFYFRWWFSWGIIAQHCAHCGLPKFAAESSDMAGADLSGLRLGERAL